MFFFKSKKPILKDLIPQNYVDIHSHLIPSIDDGSKSMDETFSMINQLQEIGFKEFITTPHIYTSVWNNTEEVIKNKIDEVNSFLREKSKNICINAAAEYMLDSFFLQRLENEKLLTLKDQYLLIEMSYLNAPIQLYDIIFQIQLAGYTPVLAHPERYGFYHNNFKEFEKLKKSGCLFQMNLLSAVDYYGKNVTICADKLLKNNFIDFVGSDIHHQKHIDSFSKKIDLKNIDALEKAMKNNLLFLS